VTWTTSSLDTVDDSAAHDTPIGDSLRRNASVALETGGAGLLREATLYMSAWGFDPARISCPVEVWAGSRDRLIPEVMGRRLAQSIPGAALHLEADEGHFGLLHRRVREIISGAMPQAFH
jgi:pimeloyl-ACP methyl ester carboxylesterase